MLAGGLGSRVGTVRLLARCWLAGSHSLAASLVACWLPALPGCLLGGRDCMHARSVSHCTGCVVHFEVSSTSTHSSTLQELELHDKVSKSHLPLSSCP